MRVLLVEDNRPLADWLAKALRQSRFVVDCMHDGADADHVLRTQDYAVVLLDVSLPRMDGWEVLRRLRARGNHAPVLLLTAHGGVEDRVRGLDLGADDYLPKPFELAELEARMRALIRRAAGQAGNELRCGPLTLDLRGARVCLDGQPLTLTSHEFRVLAYLMQRRGQAVTRSELSEHVYPLDSERDSNTIEVFVGRLRKKLPAGMIETLRGLGYRMNDTP